MPVIPYSWAISGKSSVEILANVNVPASSVLTASNSGASILHGPHHDAQKSTMTGRGDGSTSVLNVWAVSSCTMF